jgi:hypothetical protein
VQSALAPRTSAQIARKAVGLIIAFNCESNGRDHEIEHREK